VKTFSFSAAGVDSGISFLTLTVTGVPLSCDAMPMVALVCSK
jgi:hypothetical protein